MKKLLRILILIFIIFSIVILCSGIGYANESNIPKLKLIEKSDEFKKWENLSEEEREKTIQPSYSNISLKKSIKRSKYNTIVGANENNINSVYDLRKDKNYKMTVKNQQRTNCCWAFSFSSIMESTLSEKYNKAQNQFSPEHIDYRTSQMFQRTIGEGGNAYLALAYCADGYGPIYESELRFDDVYDEDNNSEDTYYLKDINSVDLNKEAKARVKDAIIFPSIDKVYSSDGNIKYQGTSEQIKYTEDEVNANRELIKKHIKQYGAVTTCIYSDIGQLPEGGYISIGGYYNPETKAYYCNNSTTAGINHAVTIVGWDDTFKKENFAEGKQPPEDGAYIVLNSYGEEFGEEGYFYISYYDAYIEEMVAGITSIEEYNNGEKDYEKIYQYDELGISHALSLEATSVYTANVFSRENAQKTEYISEVGVYMPEAEGIEIYVNPSDDKLTNLGNLVASYTGTNALEAGYHTLKLSSPVKLTGSKFVVAVKYINQENAIIPIECNLSENKLADVGNMFDKVTSNPGESYISLNGNDWVDFYGMNLSQGIVLKSTNACIKAITTTSVPTVNVTSIELNKTTYKMQVGDEGNLIATVQPENATNKNVKWSSSNEKVATITSNGIIAALAKGETIITATTEDGSYTAKCTLTVTEKTNSDDDIYKDKNNSNGVNNESKNNTFANKILPYAGSKLLIILLVVGVITVAILYKNYKKFDDVK